MGNDGSLNVVVCFKFDVALSFSLTSFLYISPVFDGLLNVVVFFKFYVTLLFSLSLFLYISPVFFFRLYFLRSILS